MQITFPVGGKKLTVGDDQIVHQGQGFVVRDGDNYILAITNERGETEAILEIEVHMWDWYAPKSRSKQPTKSKPKAVGMTSSEIPKPQTPDEAAYYIDNYKEHNWPKPSGRIYGLRHGNSSAGDRVTAELDKAAEAADSRTAAATSNKQPTLKATSKA